MSPMAFAAFAHSVPCGGFDVVVVEPKNILVAETLEIPVIIETIDQREARYDAEPNDP